MDLPCSEISAVTTSLLCIATQFQRLTVVRCFLRCRVRRKQGDTALNEGGPCPSQSHQQHQLQRHSDPVLLGSSGHHPYLILTRPHTLCRHVGPAKWGTLGSPVNHDLSNLRIISFLESGFISYSCSDNDCKLGGLRQHIFKIVRRCDPDWGEGV